MPFYRRSPHETESSTEAEIDTIHSDADLSLVSQDVNPTMPEVMPGSPEYFISLPEVNNMIRRSKLDGGILAKFKGTTVNNISERLESAPLDRRLKRALENSGFVSCVTGSAQALAEVLSKPGQYPRGDVPARYGTAMKMLSPFRGMLPILNEEAVYGDIYKAAANLEPELLAYRDNSENLVARLNEDFCNRPEGWYELTKLIAAGHPDGEPSEKTGQTLQASHNWLLKLVVDPYQNGNSLALRLMKDLSVGEYDSWIAHDALIQSDEYFITTLISLIEKVTNSTLDTDQYLRLAQSNASWPKEAHSVILEKRGVMLAAMQFSFDKARQELAQSIGIVGGAASSEERFIQSMQKMITTVKNVGPGTMGDAAPQVLRKRFAETGRRRVGEVATKPMPIAQEAVRQAENTLTVVDKDGNVYPQDSDKFREVFEDVLADFRGTPGFQDDLTHVLSYLTKIDFHSPQLRSGLAKLSEGDWRVRDGDELKRKALYRFKINEAPGLSTKSQIIKKHRIILTLVDNDTVGIVGITHRDKFSNYLKSLGIGTGSR